MKNAPPGIRHFHQTVKLCIDLVEYLGLLVIACATTYAGMHEILTMIGKHEVTLPDLLLLFLYLEVLAMVGVYFKTGQLPVRFPLYIAIVAVARHVIIDLKTMTDLQLLAATSSIVILAIAVLLIRYGHTRFPYSSGEDSSDVIPETPNNPDTPAAETAKSANPLQ